VGREGAEEDVWGKRETEEKCVSSLMICTAHQIYLLSSNEGGWEGMTILKWILNDIGYMSMDCMYSSGLGQEQVTGCCAQGNEHFEAIHSVRSHYHAQYLYITYLPHTSL
jgi:hypothetical protein